MRGNANAIVTNVMLAALLWVTGCGIEAFTCGDGLEIPALFVCDNTQDCTDNSDEADC